MADSEEDDTEIKLATNKKSKGKKGKFQNFITGRARRRVNSENEGTLAQTRLKFVNASFNTMDQGVCPSYTNLLHLKQFCIVPGMYLTTHSA